MADIPASNEPTWTDGKSKMVTGAEVVQVPASAQEAPGAIHRCPVCGQPYMLASQPVDDQPAETTSADARRVLLCASCGTYSVGTLDGTDEQANP